MSLMTLLMGTLHMSVPLIFAAYGGLLSERAGIVQIALEAYLLVGALTAAIVAHFTGSPWLALFSAGLCGLLFAGFEGIFVLFLRVDQIITGTALNLFAAGLGPFITKAFFDSTGATPSLPPSARFTSEPLYLTFILILLVSYWFYHTRSGLAVQFAGESPETLAVSGSSVQRVRWASLLGCGFVSSCGGAILSVYLSSSYSANMTGGRGFIALAALIFGKWKPLPTLAACLFFAFTDALQMRLQGNTGDIPVQFVQILPYLFTVIALAGFFGQSRAPKALGKHWNS
jgi:ABC-type uncharacterized transport system permease subunit